MGNIMQIGGYNSNEPRPKASYRTIPGRTNVAAGTRAASADISVGVAATLKIEPCPRGLSVAAGLENRALRVAIEFCRIVDLSCEEQL